jgi:hypothetical protein
MELDIPSTIGWTPSFWTWMEIQSTQCYTVLFTRFIFIILVRPTNKDLKCDTIEYLQDLLLQTNCYEQLFFHAYEILQQTLHGILSTLSFEFSLTLPQTFIDIMSPLSAKSLSSFFPVISCARSALGILFYIGVSSIHS